MRYIVSMCFQFSLINWLPIYSLQPDWLIVFLNYVQHVLDSRTSNLLIILSGMIFRYLLALTPIPLSDFGSYHIIERSFMNILPQMENTFFFILLLFPMKHLKEIDITFIWAKFSGKYITSKPRIQGRVLGWEMNFNLAISYFLIFILKLSYSFDIHVTKVSLIPAYICI